MGVLDEDKDDDTTQCLICEQKSNSITYSAREIHCRSTSHKSVNYAWSHYAT